MSKVRQMADHRVKAGDVVKIPSSKELFNQVMIRYVTETKNAFASQRDALEEAMRFYLEHSAPRRKKTGTED